MRNTLLATVAAAALVAGTVMVSAQGTGGAGRRLAAFGGSPALVGTGREDGPQGRCVRRAVTRTAAQG